MKSSVLEKKKLAIEVNQIGPKVWPHLGVPEGLHIQETFIIFFRMKQHSNTCIGLNPPSFFTLPLGPNGQSINVRNIIAPCLKDDLLPKVVKIRFQWRRNTFSPIVNLCQLSSIGMDSSWSIRDLI